MSQETLVFWGLCSNTEDLLHYFPAVKPKNNDSKDCLALTTIGSDQPSHKHGNNDSIEDSSMVLLNRSAGEELKIQTSAEKEEKTQIVSKTLFLYKPVWNQACLDTI